MRHAGRRDAVNYIAQNAVVICLCALLLAAPLAAAQLDGLEVDDLRIVASTDVYGLPTQTAVGYLTNRSRVAFTNIVLYAEAYDAGGALIGEGIGYLVKACGEALLPTFALQPGMSEPFAIFLERFGEGEIDRVEIVPQATAVTPDPALQRPAAPAGVTEVTAREVVAVEWIDAQTLRYSGGCWRDVFTNRPWFTYDLSTRAIIAEPHPRAGEVTPQMLRALRLEDPAIFNRSFFAFAPNERRAVYQEALNTLVTAEPNGSFRRILFDQLYNISLQGINFLRPSGGVFLAYYHGGYGDTVLYGTATVDGQTLSQHPTASLPSLIVPGAAPNGQRVIIAAEVDGVTGYYLRATNTDFSELLFEGEAPGNNWPAPIYDVPETGDPRVYVARLVGGAPTLQCFNRVSRQLHDLTPLPLRLETDDRAWMWFSPQANQIALAANGVFGGLWLIDLAALPACD